MSQIAPAPSVPLVTFPLDIPVRQFRRAVSVWANRHDAPYRTLLYVLGSRINIERGTWEMTWKQIRNHYEAGLSKQGHRPIHVPSERTLQRWMKVLSEHGIVTVTHTVGKPNKYGTWIATAFGWNSYTCDFGRVLVNGTVQPHDFFGALADEAPDLVSDGLSDGLTADLSPNISQNNDPKNGPEHITADEVPPFSSEPQGPSDDQTECAPKDSGAAEDPDADVAVSMARATADEIYRHFPDSPGAQLNVLTAMFLDLRQQGYDWKTEILAAGMLLFERHGHRDDIANPPGFIHHLFPQTVEEVRHSNQAAKDAALEADHKRIEIEERQAKARAERENAIALWTSEVSRLESIFSTIYAARKADPENIEREVEFEIADQEWSWARTILKGWELYGREIKPVDKRKSRDQIRKDIARTREMRRDN